MPDGRYSAQAFGGISLYIGGHGTLHFAFCGQWLHNILRGSRLLYSWNPYFMDLLVLLYA